MLELWRESVQEVLQEKSGKSAAAQVEARAGEVEASIKRRRVVVCEAAETEKELLNKVREKARLLAVERIRRAGAPEKGGFILLVAKVKDGASERGDKEAAARLLATSAALRAHKSMEEDLAEAERLAAVLEEQRLKATRFAEHYEA